MTGEIGREQHPSALTLALLNRNIATNSHLSDQHDQNRLKRLIDFARGTLSDDGTNTPGTGGEIFRKGYCSTEIDFGDGLKLVPARPAFFRKDFLIDELRFIGSVCKDFTLQPGFYDRLSSNDISQFYHLADTDADTFGLERRILAMFEGWGLSALADKNSTSDKTFFAGMLALQMAAPFVADYEGLLDRSVLGNPLYREATSKNLPLNPKLENEFIVFTEQTKFDPDKKDTIARFKDLINQLPRSIERRWETPQTYIL